ncbi:unnamed protein product [Callosobruchus maculatus]|uniref:Uncharacterized protein n=1 Tax=Callosobruchus maculatus TaxID=64391 RepID=A0A653DPE7_CALMS|nr:unnamed protein product [Callosobruchus maculatus]
MEVQTLRASLNSDWSLHILQILLWAELQTSAFGFDSAALCLLKQITDF